MVLDLIWAAGGVVSIAGLLCGAYLVMMETEPLLSLLGKKPAVPLPLSVKDLRIIEGLARCDLAGHPLAGNDVVDTEHQALFDDMNRLRAAICSGRSVDEVDATIDVLIRDVVQHFQNEEAILVAAGYPGTAKHTALHRELGNSAAALAGRFRSGMLGVGGLFRFLARDVITRHMLDADREFIPYLENRQSTV